MAKYDKYGVTRTRHGYISPETITNLIRVADDGSTRRGIFTKELSRVFNEANRRIGQLATLDNFSDIPAAEALDIKLDMNLFRYNKNKGTDIFKSGSALGRMSDAEKLAAYQAAVDFLEMPSSTYEVAKQYVDRIKDQIFDALLVGRNVTQLSGFKESELKSLDELMVESGPGVKEEITLERQDENGNAAHVKLELKADDNMITRIGKAWNAANDLLKQLGLIGSPERENQTGAGRTYEDRFIDILAGYLFARDADVMTFEEKLNNAIDDFIELQTGAKSPGDTSPSLNQSANKLAAAPNPYAGDSGYTLDDLDKDFGVVSPESPFKSSKVKRSLK